MIHPMTIEEFYQAALKQAGVTANPPDLQKIASDKGCSVEMVILAKGFFEQLQLDQVPYENEQLRAVDSMKMAEAYFEHIEETKTASVETADGLLRFLKHAAEGFCAQHQIPLDGFEALKVAGLQAESAQEFESEAKKTAAVSGMAPASIGGGGGSTPAAATTPAMYDPSNAHTAFNAANPEAAMYLINKQRPGTFAQGATAEHLADYANRFPAQSPSSGGDWASRNAGGLALGAAGLGALYLWHKNKKDEERAQQERQMSALRAAALPPA